MRRGRYAGLCGECRKRKGAEEAASRNGAAEDDAEIDVEEQDEQGAQKLQRTLLAVAGVEAPVEANGAASGLTTPSRRSERQSLTEVARKLVPASRDFEKAIASNRQTKADLTRAFDKFKSLLTELRETAQALANGE